MESDFAFRGPVRRVARAVVDAMVPRWPEFEPDLTDAVLDQVEGMVRNHPPFIRAGLVAALCAIELSGPLVLDGVRPTSRLPRDRVVRRLERLADHRLPQVRQLVVFMKILVSFSAYSRPEVEAFLGVRRREWRQARKTFRDALVQLDEARGSAPPVPAPLVPEGAVAPPEYLRFDARPEGAR